MIAPEDCLDAHRAGAVIADAEFPVGIALTADTFNAFAKVIAVGIVGRNNNADKRGVLVELKPFPDLLFIVVDFWLNLF